MRLQPNIGSDRSWVWKVAADYSESPPTAETLAIRFTNSDTLTGAALGDAATPPAEVRAAEPIAAPAGEDAAEAKGDFSRGARGPSESSSSRKRALSEVSHSENEMDPNECLPHSLPTAAPIAKV
ncbi:hypothetical protein B0H11DRAFT_1937420 [Mycena galericulata]|nr:hypothetical protein B0H11DRAFT_1937420 [Mycena galericulata]